MLIRNALSPACSLGQGQKPGKWMSNTTAKKGIFMLFSCPTSTPTLIPEVSQGFGEGKGNPQSCKVFDEIGTKRGKERKEMMKSCNSPFAVWTTSEAKDPLTDIFSPISDHATFLWQLQQFHT